MKIRLIIGNIPIHRFRPGSQGCRWPAPWRVTWKLNVINNISNNLTSVRWPSAFVHWNQRIFGAAVSVAPTQHVLHYAVSTLLTRLHTTLFMFKYSESVYIRKKMNISKRNENFWFCIHSFIRVSCACAFSLWYLIFF